MKRSLRWTSAALESLPENGTRYEIIDGELYVSKQPQWHHQIVCGRLFSALDSWSVRTGMGAASIAPGVIFAADDDVAPDVVWVRESRLNSALDSRGHLREAPDLAVEVLSPGTANEQRDRDAKLSLFSRRGVLEYWIVSWHLRQIDIYCQRDQALELARTLHEADALESPILPGFSCPVAALFVAFPGE